jgi:leucyl-tRNA synthetase
MNDLLLLLAPCAPHFTEELWEKADNRKSIFTFPYPVCNEAALVLDEVEYAVQINSKVRAKITVSSSLDEAGIRETVLADAQVQELTEGKEPKKVIVVKGRLVNIIL